MELNGINTHKLFEIPTTHNQQPVTRAALDLGSGTFKLSVAKVNGKLVQVKFSKVIRIGLGLDLAEGSCGSFSEKIQNYALNALIELINNAKEEGAVQFAGIATASFRHARNGKEFLQKLKSQTGIDLHLVSQEEEGTLAFKTFLNVFPEINPENCITLDLGAASFQLTAKNKESYDVLKGPLGVSGVFKTFAEEIKKISYQRGLIFTPITVEEIILLIGKIESKILTQPWIQTKLSDKTVEILFLDDWIDEIQERGNLKEMASKNQIWESLLKAIDSINAAPTLKKQSNIMAYVLLYSIMSKLQIDELKMKLHYTGSTPGILTEEHFWS